MNSVKLKPGLALDIDETLSWTIGYWAERMLERFGNPEKLTVKELIKKYRYAQNVPYWQSQEALDWMEHHRHSDEVQEELPLIEGAVVFVKKINAVVPISAYLTVRPEAVIKGTEGWLKKHNFPKAPVICRPKDVPAADGNKWKAKVLKELYPGVRGIIDDNLGLLKFLEPDYKGKVFLYGHESASTSISAISCMDWGTAYEKIKKEFGSGKKIK